MTKTKCPYCSGKGYFKHEDDICLACEGTGNEEGLPTTSPFNPEEIIKAEITN